MIDSPRVLISCMLISANNAIITIMNYYNIWHEYDMKLSTKQNRIYFYLFCYFAWSHLKLSSLWYAEVAHWIAGSFCVKISTHLKCPAALILRTLKKASSPSKKNATIWHVAGGIAPLVINDAVMNTQMLWMTNFVCLINWLV